MFCRNCGKEVDDNAYACTGCGTLLKAAAMPQAVLAPQRAFASPEQVASGKVKVAKIFAILAFSFACLTLFLLLGTLGTMYIYTYSNLYSVDVRVRYDEVLIIMALLMGLTALAMGIVGMIMGLRCKDKAISLVNVLVFIFAVTMMFACFFFVGNL